MDYALRIDKNAQAMVPDVKGGKARVALDGSEICVTLGKELLFKTDVGLVSSAEQIADPRPTVYFTMGVSAAFDQMGRDTVAALGSHDGLVRLDFSRPVEGTVRPADLSPKGQPGPEPATIRFQHLILSMSDPAGFVQAVNDQARSTGPGRQTEPDNLYVETVPKASDEGVAARPAGNRDEARSGS
jgi:hypothetical protein